MNARTADNAATCPWSGITGRPSSFPTDPSQINPAGAPDHGVMVFSQAQNRWVPVSLAQLKTWLNALP